MRTRFVLTGLSSAAYRDDYPQWNRETRRSQRVTSETGRQVFFGAQYSY